MSLEGLMFDESRGAFIRGVKLGAVIGATATIMVFVLLMWLMP